MQISAAAVSTSDLDRVNESCPYGEVEARKSPEAARPVSIPEPSESVSKDRALAMAYWDAMRILGTSNRCSMFFGGPIASVDVFSNFMGRVSRAYLPAGIGLKMSGDYVNVLNAETKVRYRLFDKASLNSEGPFYKRKTPASGTISGVGTYPPATREGRVLMLLHELGHLMRSSTGEWLLPDDGDRMAESLNNTRKIESVCGEQLRAIDKQEPGPEALRQNNLEQSVSPAAATSSQH
jgi:hypothetical protein